MRGPRIMVVDDQRGMLRAVQRVLEGHGQVSLFASSREALAAAVEIRPDIAILDVRIPEMDGFDLLARLKKVVPGVDVILMTGSVTDLDQKMIRSIREEAFFFIQKPFDAELLRTLVERCFQQRILREENQAHLRRLQEELSDARAFQQSLLPPPEASIGTVRVASRHLSCTELAGDICDYAAAAPGRAVLLVADVSGHGGSAAMLTGIVKSSFHAALAAGGGPGHVAAAVAGALRPFSPERFVTLVCVSIDPGAGMLTYVNAGHPPGLLWSASRPIETLDPTGPLVSPVFPVASWEPRRLPVRSGDRLLLYTDGVTEASSEDDFFGEERLRQVIAARPDGGAPLLDDVLSAVERFRGGRPQTDDLTLVAGAL